MATIKVKIPRPVHAEIQSTFMPTLGFVILSHNAPLQLKRLSDRLLSLFPTSQIVCHHDFQRCPLDVRQFQPTVWFIQPSLRTFWGHISIVNAELAALECLYIKADPDWFYILSAADYPILESSNILDSLANSHNDAYIDFRIIPAGPDLPVGEWPYSAQLDGNELARYRYLQSTLAPYVLDAYESAPTVREADRLLAQYTDRMTVDAKRRLPSNQQCYVGDHWITANRKTAQILLADAPLRRELLEYFRHCEVPDEAFYQTLLCNRMDLRLRADNLRFSDWGEERRRPRTLDENDVPLMLRSGAHFARKFAPNSQALNLIDAIVH